MGMGRITNKNSAHQLASNQIIHGWGQSCCQEQSYIQQEWDRASFPVTLSLCLQAARQLHGSGFTGSSSGQSVNNASFNRLFEDNLTACLPGCHATLLPLAKDALIEID